MKKKVTQDREEKVAQVTYCRQFQACQEHSKNHEVAQVTYCREFRAGQENSKKQGEKKVAQVAYCLVERREECMRNNLSRSKWKGEVAQVT